LIVQILLGFDSSWETGDREPRKLTTVVSLSRSSTIIDMQIVNRSAITSQLFLFFPIVKEKGGKTFYFPTRWRKSSKSGKGDRKETLLDIPAGCLFFL
jgi:Mor family transcriptional regulator